MKFEDCFTESLTCDPVHCSLQTLRGSYRVSNEVFLLKFDCAILFTGCSLDALIDYLSNDDYVIQELINEKFLSEQDYNQYLAENKELEVYRNKQNLRNDFYALLENHFIDDFITCIVPQFTSWNIYGVEKKLKENLLKKFNPNP